MWRFIIRTICCILLSYGHVVSPAHAQGKTIDLSYESAIGIAMANSYRVRQLQMGIERTRHYLMASRAGLKSRVYMNLRMPDINSTSENKWNSTLQKDEIIRENSRRWQMDLSVRQPVILLGYPTNGYLSLNNKVYRYDQKKDDGSETDYYNRYFVEFEQPFFQPNYLKNDIENSELALEREELEYLDDIVDMIDDIADDYYDLYEEVYVNQIIERQIGNLEQVLEIAQELAASDSTRQFDVMQIQVELANTRERALEQQSNIRMESSGMIQRLRLDPSDTLQVDPLMEIIPITVDAEQAIEYGYTLRPQLRLLNNQRRRDEIDIDEINGYNSFRMNLEMTYGLERQDEDYQKLWEDQDNSYSVSLNAYIPIWDWGQRKERIAAEEISLQKTELYIEEAQNNIRSEITMAVANLQEYQDRALSMRENAGIARDLTEQSILRYAEKSVSVQDILRIIERQYDTENNLLDAYLGYRQSLQSLMVDTYYDYEHASPIIDRFIIPVNTEN